MLGPISGAHMNPAVSLVAAVAAGASATGHPVLHRSPSSPLAWPGVWAAHLMFDLPVLQISTKVRTGLGQWTGEVIATFGLILTIIGVASSSARRRPGGCRALHQRRLLVHLLDELRQSRDHRRPQPLRQLYRDRAGGLADVRCCPAPRRGAGGRRRAPALRCRTRYSSVLISTVSPINRKSRNGPQAASKGG